jgi:hypothetical protein
MSVLSFIDALFAVFCADEVERCCAFHLHYYHRYCIQRSRSGAELGGLVRGQEIPEWPGNLSNEH